MHRFRAVDLHCDTKNCFSENCLKNVCKFRTFSTRDNTNVYLVRIFRSKKYTSFNYSCMSLFLYIWCVFLVHFLLCSYQSVLLFYPIRANHCYCSPFSFSVHWFHPDLLVLYSFTSCVCSSRPFS